MGNKITLSASSLTAKLVAALTATVTETATARTTKYMTSQPDFKQRLNDVVDTIVGLMSCYGSTVEVDGVSFDLSDYKVPAKLVSLVNSGRIYASSDCIGRVEPMFEVEHVGVSMTPESFNRFFIDYNVNQGDNGIQLSEGLTRRTITLEDVQYLEDEDGMMCKLHDGGFDIELCYLIGLEIDALTPYLTKYSKPTDLGVGLWLLK